MRVLLIRLTDDRPSVPGPITPTPTRSVWSDRASKPGAGAPTATRVS